MRSILNFSIYSLLLVCLVGTTACNRRNSNATSDGAARAVRPHGHSHGHGPNGGHIVELDTVDYHAEITQEDASHRIGVHLLDGNASAAVAVPIETASVAILVAEEDKPTEYKLPAVAQRDGEAGKSSYFEIESEPLLAVLQGGKQLKAPPELRITIDGKSYAGVIENEHAHDLAMSHSHTDGPDETLVWQRQLSEAGYDIALGHHGVILLAGSKVEPAAQLTRGGEPVADAKIFNALLSADGDSVLADEVATVYEPPTEEEPAHYAQGGLKIPPGTREAILRFRVVFPEAGGERTFDVPVAVR